MTAPQGQEEYVPTTEQVRTGYATGAYRFLTGTSYSLAAFDRWLAAHDAEVREQVALDLVRIAEASRVQAATTTGLERSVFNANARCFDTAADVARATR